MASLTSTNFSSAASAPNILPFIMTPTETKHSLCIALLSSALLAACSTAPQNTNSSALPSPTVKTPVTVACDASTAPKVTALQTIDLPTDDPVEKGVDKPKEKTAVDGSVVLVQYTGWLYDACAPDHKGAEFENSASRKTPFGFFVGKGRVIKGWDEGVVGMKEGGKRRLIIPAAMAYGSDASNPKIPANSDLVFEIQIVKILGN